MRAAALSVSLLLLASFGNSVAMHPQSGGGHATSFDHRTGNEWWVEVIVAGRPARVEARDDGGAWKPLALKSWGAWAASFHIEPGHRVQFRASWSDAASVESCWFTHPAGVEQCDGTPPPPPPTQGTSVSFTHGGGNEWWVEAKVSPKPAKVEAMDTNGPWVVLSFKDWGEWAGSFRIEPGHAIRFRATYADGSSAISCWFTHPGGIAGDEDQTRTCTASTGGSAPPPPSWPVEGSFVKYEASEGEGFGDQYQQEAIVNVTYTFTGGRWERACEGWEREWFDTGSEWERYSETRILSTTATGPPMVTASVKPGDTAFVPGTDCIWGGSGGTVFGPVRQNTTRNGSSVSVVVNYINYQPVWPASHGGVWDVGTKLVIGWSFTGSHGGNHGQLVDTDAPMTTQAPARTSWPFEGSFATYALNDTEDRHTLMQYRFTDGGWHLSCTRYDASGRPEGAQSSRRAPFYGPLTGTAVGSELDLPLPGLWCDAEWDTLYVERTQSYMTTRNGAPYKAKVWYADEDDSWNVDFDVFWDTRTGLYVEFDHNAEQGRLTNTDAPLASG